MSNALTPPRPHTGVDGLCAPSPGEKSADADSAEGVRGSRSQPAGGQPVASLFLVLYLFGGYAHCGLHSGLHASPPFWW